MNTSYTVGNEYFISRRAADEAARAISLTVSRYVHVIEHADSPEGCSTQAVATFCAGQRV
jgi:hypothetical protein